MCVYVYITESDHTDHLIDSLDTHDFIPGMYIDKKYIYAHYLVCTLNLF